VKVTARQEIGCPRNRIEMAGAKEINFAREGKVLRVLPSGRWVPRNQG